MVLQKVIAILFGLFLICFIAIFIEETCLAGRRRRKLERKARREQRGREMNG